MVTFEAVVACCSIVNCTIKMVNMDLFHVGIRSSSYLQFVFFRDGMREQADNVFMENQEINKVALERLRFFLVQQFLSV